MSFLLLVAALAALWALALYFAIDIGTNWYDLFVSKGVSDTTWEYALKFVGVGIVAFLLAFTALFHGHEWIALTAAPLLLYGAAGALTIRQGYTVIPAQPVTRGILTYWGERQDIILSEGEHLLPKFWPLNIDVILEEVESVTFRFRFDGIPCQGETDEQGIGATVTVEVAGAFEVDYEAREAAERLMEFQNRGGTKNILEILHANIEQELRHYSIGYRWEHFMRLKEPMAATLVASLSTARPRALRPEGEELPKNMRSMDSEAYLKLEQIDDPMGYMRRTEGDKPETERKRREMEIFLERLRTAGFGDIPDLGIQLLRFNIPSIEPEGAVKAATDRAAAEKKEKEQEEQDANTEIARAKKYIDADPTGSMTMDRALQRVAVNRGLATEVVISGGERSPLTDAAAINALADQKKKGT